MESEVRPSRATSEYIQSRLGELTSREGPWTGHNIEVARGVFTRGPSPSGDEPRFRVVKQLAADLCRRPLQSLRVLDLGALEGQYGIEFALEGAEVVFIEGREPSAQKIRFALNALGVEGASVRTEDVRNLNRNEHGDFDLVLCIGVLYHLDQAGVFGLIRRMREVCTDLLILDTQVARKDGEIAQYERDKFWVDPRTLSDMREIEIDGQRYRGRDYIEADRAEDLPDAPWSSLDNLTSFWLTMPSLVNALRTAGFTTVLNPVSPWLNWPPDRGILVAKAGDGVRLSSTSLTPDAGDSPVPEWQAATTRAPRGMRVGLRARVGRYARRFQRHPQAKRAAGVLARPVRRLPPLGWVVPESVKRAARARLAPDLELTPWPLGHYYSPVPDSRALAREPTRSRVWPPIPRTTPGIDWREHEQVALVEQLARESEMPIAEHPTGDARDYYSSNDMYPPLDAWLLQGMLRHFRPRRTIEVGCGLSSLVTARVNREYLDGSMDFTCVEPYPPPFLAAGVEGISRLMTVRVEELPIDPFLELGDGDVLFIDTSHAVKTGGDVVFLYQEILPRLASGVIVHIHDIFLPADYPREWVLSGRGWNEQYLVSAFLTLNSAFKVLLGAAWLGHNRPDVLAAALPEHPEWRKHGGGSLWIQRV